MPLTGFQRRLLATLAEPPTDERYLAGGAALHLTPHSARYSEDLDFFHDTEARVASAFAADRARLTAAGYTVEVELSLPGFVRAVVYHNDSATRVDWAHDSAWRFMPLVRDPVGGLMLHPVDLACNKVLALAGRDEPRDFVDILYVHRRVLPLGALCWATVGKDPGFTPLSLLELLKRRGRYRPADFTRLQLVEPFDVVGAKALWLAALEEAEGFIRMRPTEEAGALYYHQTTGRFVVPRPDVDLAGQGLVTHYGGPFGVVPRLTNVSIEASE